MKFLRAHTDRTIKITVPGPFTMAQQAQNDFYKDEDELAMDYAAAVNEEIKDLFAAGADIVQIDEPYMQARPEKAREYRRRGAQPRARRRRPARRRVHICFGYAAIIHERPTRLFVPAASSRDCSVNQISIETAQSHLDLRRACEAAAARRSSSACSTCRRTDRDAGDRGRAHRAARCPMSMPGASSSRRIAA